MENVEQEIIRFHEFFVDWMTGTLSQTNDNFSQFADSLSDDFYIVSPMGKLSNRDALIKQLYSVHNQRHNFRIWIDNVEVRHTFGDNIVATYEEWKETKDDNNTTALISTVVFTSDKSKPNGLCWQCVHETRLHE